MERFKRRAQARCGWSAGGQVNALEPRSINPDQSVFGWSSDGRVQSGVTSRPLLMTWTGEQKPPCSVCVTGNDASADLTCHQINNPISAAPTNPISDR